MKNTITSLVFINRVLMVLTCILFITVYLFYFGMLLEVLLGGFHIVTTLILMIFWKALDKDERNRIIIYGVLVIIYFSMWFLFDVFGRADEFYKVLIWIILLPMSLAFYLTFTLEKIKDRLK